MVASRGAQERLDKYEGGKREYRLDCLEQSSVKKKSETSGDVNIMHLHRTSAQTMSDPDEISFPEVHVSALIGADREEMVDCLCVSLARN
jgi:hypothetical protein